MKPSHDAHHAVSAPCLFTVTSPTLSPSHRFVQRSVNLGPQWGLCGRAAGPASGIRRRPLSPFPGEYGKMLPFLPVSSCLLQEHTHQCDLTLALESLTL